MVKLNGEQNAPVDRRHRSVNHRLVLEIGLYSDSTLGTVTMNTVGRPVQATLARIKSIRLAEAKVRDSVVVTHDLPDASEGVLREFQV